MSRQLPGCRIAARPPSPRPYRWRFCCRWASGRSSACTGSSTSWPRSTSAEAAPPVPLGADPAPFTKVVATRHVAAGYRPLWRGRPAAARMASRRWAPSACRSCGAATRCRCWSISAGCRMAPGRRVRSAKQHDHRLCAHRRSCRPVVRRGRLHGAPFLYAGPGGDRRVAGRARFGAVHAGRHGRREGPGDPVPATALPRPPNNHLQYAFTWFGLAAALVGVSLPGRADASRMCRRARP